MRDLLPDEVALREWATTEILGAYARYGFRRVETPALENIARLTGGQGGDNEKLIFKILKRGDKLNLSAAKSDADVVDFGLRYDLTVPLARFFAEHRGALGTPFKAIQVGPVWRAERPQKGRYRQFTQCDIDVLGDGSTAVEIELIEATLQALAALGFEGLVVRMNDRRLLGAMVAECGFDDARAGAVLIAVDKLDKLGVDGVCKELAEAEHPEPAVAKLRAFLERADSSGDPSGDGALDALAELLAEVEPAVNGIAGLRRLTAELNKSLPGGARVQPDPTLVRGMGYYTSTIFEIALEGVPYSLGGGGRYDKMIGDMIGGEVPACGFSIGFERIVLELQQRGMGPREVTKLAALLHDPKRDDPLAVTAAARAWRDSGVHVTVLPKRKKLGTQLDELAASGVDQFWVFVPDSAAQPKPLGEGAAS